MLTVPFAAAVSAVIFSDLGGATLSLASTLNTLAELFGSTVMKSAFARVRFRLNMRIASVRTRVVPLWLITCVTLVCVQSLPTSVSVNWMADVASATVVAIDGTSGTKPDGGAMLVDTSHAPLATMMNGYCAVSSTQS